MSVKWTIARARQKFSELLRDARSEPQPIYNRDELVAAVIDARSYAEFLSWFRDRKAESFADAFDALRAIAVGDEELFTAPARADRPNEFTRALDEIPR